MNSKERLLKRLPKKYHFLIEDFEAEGDLIDDCKYMIYFIDNVTLFGYERMGSYPVKSIKEAIDVIKHDAEYDWEALCEINN